MDIVKYISVIVASMLKFFMGPITGYALGVPISIVMICACIGMMLSVSLTLTFGTLINNYLASRPNTKRTLFSKRIRFAVKIYQKLGLFGIAMLTPPLFMPIGGTLMALSFKIRPLRIALYMLFSAVFYAIVGTFLVYQLDYLVQGLKAVFA
jgi:hypothetical protein